MAQQLSRHLRSVLTLSFIIFHWLFCAAQDDPQTPTTGNDATEGTQKITIKIAGNVYGGGNAGDTDGSTKVTVYAGNLNNVYGGARMADVKGSTFVHIDGENASDNIFITNVYGGNDIAGKVGTEGNTVTVPGELTEVLRGEETLTDYPKKNTIDGSWNAFVRTSPTPVETNRKSLVIGSLFGGGNGDYGDSDNDNKYVDGTPYAGKTKPVLGKTYLEILGGCIAHLYGGGNNATVTGNTTICINNNSPVLTQTNVWPAETTTPEGKKQLAALAQRVGLSTAQADLSSYDFNFARVFGGNNKAPMAIRPKWNLQAGIIRDIYSGGNQGAMTHENGILLYVAPLESAKLQIENVFGGCRMANVNPAKIAIHEETIDGTYYPPGYAARVVIMGGDIQNVYGGNDISGNIFGGNAVGIHSSIKGDVYGGGNGSYAYTDKATYVESHPEYSDFYYNPGSNSVEALNAFRPNAEAVSIRVAGTADKKTVIGGAIYCGGNSATLRNDDPTKNATSQLKIGSYVIADKVFLGNNGANMVTEDMLKKYADESFSSLKLTQSDVFDKYMDGCAMMIKPNVVFDDIGTYVPYSTYFGSFYCGGNVGSMKIDGAMEVSFNDAVVIFDKVVGGSNEANVYEKYIGEGESRKQLNAQYLGGLLGSTDTNGNKLILNFGGLKIQPKRWKIQRDANTYAPILNNDGNEQYDLDDDGNRQLEWNTVDSRTFDPITKKYTPMAPVAKGSSSAYDPDTDLYRRFHGGNIYGGCYNNGHVNGNVVINLNASLVDRKGENAIFDEVEENEGEAKLYDGNYNIKKRYTGVLIGEQGMDPLGRALNVFGGGYGGDSEIWGSATINLNAGYTFQIFGGGEQGAIGNAISHAPDPDDPTIHNLEYEYNETYSTYINLKDKNNHAGTYRGDTDDSDGVVDYDDMAEAEFIYGGSFEGLIAGSTHINLGNGRIFNSFAGSCNADILGHTETYVGRNSQNDNDLGFPWIRDHIYGGNDLGGRILGSADFTNRVSTDIVDKVFNPKGKEKPDVLIASAYTEYIQGRVEYLFGGCYGDYDYTDSHFDAYTTNEGTSIIKDGKPIFFKPWMDNAFVNFKPNNTGRNAVARVYGAGQGHRYLHTSDADRDKMQDRSYVLINAPQSLTNFSTMEVFGAGDYSGVGMRNEAATTRTVKNVEEEIVPALNPSLAQANEDGVTASTVIDLASGQIGAAYGASFKEGVTRRTIVNVPVGSTIQIGSIFGGAYGSNAYLPCDVYEANVNYLTQSEDAYLISNPASKLTKGAIYGGNNYARRTLYGKININAPVRQKHHKYGMTTATVYGAGCGSLTWNEYTEVNLNDGAKVWEVYGGGEAGSVMSAESVQAYISGFKPDYWPKEKDTDPDVEFTAADWLSAWTLGGGYDPVIEGKTPLEALGTGYANNPYTNLTNPLVRTAEIDDRANIASTDTKHYKRYNTNVIINKGAYVGNYAYGGGLGNEDDAFVGSGDVYGTTYIALLGGTVNKDLYAAGTSGAVYNIFGADFTASATAYIEGGLARNVYGGGWKGSVGYHAGDITADYYDSSTGELKDIPGETHVVIGILKDNLPTTIPTGETADYYFHNGIPAIERNAYGGGEGGAVWGTANITLNNGYIGYTYNKNGTDNANTANIDERYEEKIEDDTYKDEDGHFQANKLLDDAGCIFGGGYVDNSSVDFTHVTMYGGHVRNALFGGGEIAAIGRGKIQETTDADGKAVRSLQGIYRPGKTHIDLFDGYVHRNVFGGGRGYNNLGEGGKLFSDGYVFGQTEVHIHGGEVGTEEELIAGNGNVFGGGDIGYVYSAYEYDDGNGHKLPRKGVKSGVRYDGDGMYQGYYYEHDWADTGNFINYLNGIESTDASAKDRKLTEDCKVLIEPHCKVTADNVSYTIIYSKDQVVSEYDLEYLQTASPNLFNSSIDAYGKVIAENGISFTRSFTKGEYVPTSALNTLGNKDESSTEWAKLEANTNDDGIIIHNAVFAGGNTSSKGSDQETAYANSTSVYGNATASIHDCYHRDLITIGTGHIGGLYGDGNLTLVDGYRGLNITNYGTDYHYLYEEKGKSEMTIAEYEDLLDREQDYYELRYKCILQCKDDDGTIYYPKDANHTNASTLTADDILTLFAKQSNMFTTDEHQNKIPNPNYWVQNGVCSIYAGRILNTIQRADFCGVFGSRLVLQGAQDRVPEVVDYTKYTINRVREVSLNKKVSVIPSDASNDKRKMHGNYFGIYSIVNYLGNLTSDFDFGDQGTDSDEADAAGRTSNGDGTFSYLSTKGDVGTGDVRTSDNVNTGTYGPQYTGQTFYGWKRFHHDDRERNNGNSHNKVALASGVYLELTTEESTGKELNEKVWGLITGVVELDLINVQQGMGGGFVYAKNVHGKRHKTDLKNTTLTALNAGAVTRWDYRYDEPSTTSNDDDPNQRDWQTSGNFVHSTQTIIDDCYNVSHRYKGPNQVPAHYWYIKGSVYVYDQYISAYTGATNAYSEMVDIPLTITAASHGNMKLLNVQPNLYAYRNTNGEKLSGDQKLIINDIEYSLNTPITYWDWYKLTKAEQRLFEPETYISIANYKYSSGATTEFSADQVLLPEDYTTIMDRAHKEPIRDGNGNQLMDDLGNPLYETQLWDVDREKYVSADSIIRSSNNLSHGTGYILTYKVNNPTDWNTWYTERLDSNNDANKQREKNQTEGNGFEDGPTYHLKSSAGGVLGQRSYKISELISEKVQTTYQDMYSAHKTDVDNIGDQATFQRAYVATAETDITRSEKSVHLYKGSTLSETEASGASNVKEALICTKTIRLSATENLYINSVMTQDEKDTYLSNVSNDITALVGEINTVLQTDHIDVINVSTLEKMSDLTTAQLNKITALQKKELSDLLTRKKDITNSIVPAYYCTVAGLYGGDYYSSGVNYRGLEAWSSMSDMDRDKFVFNYDALDLLIDPNYSRAEGEKYQYDGDYTTAAQVENATTGNKAGYSLEKPVDYTATYNGSTNDKTDGTGKYLETDVVTSGKVYIGDELTREQFEQLPNEQRHYTPLTVTSSDVANGKTCTFYVVKAPSLMIGPTPYTTGNIISKSDFETLYPTAAEQETQTDVEVLTYSESGTYYFCREAYTPPTGSHSTVTGDVGSIISSSVYDNLTNYQKGFTIHGIAPTETSTLYVSRFSDIDDLSTEKIITVIYEYNYEESDVSGKHITPVTERHVLNIHINFKTGAPIVEDIEAPQIILPGDLLSLIPPNVIEGASPIQGGGWELYASESDADNHNGTDYTPDTDPLYWYQNDYWLRYYALSYVGGKTYSNKVQVSVANYHDLKKVMEDTEHHYYIDITDLDRLRDPKIYINDDTDGMNQLKNLFDLSLLTNGSAGVENGVVTADGPLKGQTLFENQQQVAGCQDLEFFMRTNVTMPSGSTWTPIANNTGECFAGTLHGDGHYISGLDHSLFNHLCGSVYNLGVMGTFTTSGVADAGKPASGVPDTYTDGYVENCWISTASTDSKTKKPVFGIENGSGYRIVNSYYMEEDNATNKYTNHNGNYGIPTPMPEEAFYNGTVAYDLNGFYLYKRYNDHTVLSGSPTEYKYYIPGVVDTETNRLVPQTQHYAKVAANAAYCSSGAYVGNNLVYPAGGYVEYRYADGDFRYAGGEIPSTVEERLYTDTEDGNKTKFYPIWPDDYLFFGQMLTYGHDGYDADYQSGHEEVPSPIVKNSGRLLDTNQSNRVYRAPAYFQSSVMGVAHFNPWAYLAAYSAPKTVTDTNLKPAYPNMTAIDFAGHEEGHAASAYKLGFTGKLFYQPLLDDDGLFGIENKGETPNLLVYAPAQAAANDGYANKKTHDVLNNYFIDPTYEDYCDDTTPSDYFDDGNTYGRIAVASTASIVGHLVQSNLKTTSDHLLVDERDFNCPIKYWMGNGYRMWYQRTPGNFVTTSWSDDPTPVRTTKGWEGISLPFTAEIVATQGKGELTHFYQGKTIGHEYWLRGYAGNVKQKEGAAAGVYTADFNPMAAGTNTKDYTNTFLWDYYYSQDDYQDYNTDEYQKQYYSSGYLSSLYPVRDYPYSQGGTPYLVGFPGDTYYEFDLSGIWTPSNRYQDQAIPSKGKQTITFASVTGAEIDVSDGQTGVSVSGYTFKPNYLNQKVAAGSFVMNADGNSYDKVSDATSITAFRPYFTAVAGARASETRSIIFNDDLSQLHGEDPDTNNDNVPGVLSVHPGRRTIVVSSTLKTAAEVSIVNTAGQAIATFTIEPGETITTRVYIGGVYIVHSSDGHLLKKLAVK